jgi:hypothetical protein
MLKGVKDIDKNDIYYLTSQPNIENRLFGWFSPDDLENITWKYIYFIYNMNIDYYDWYILIDDDTYIFKNNLIKLLSNYNQFDNYYIGHELDHIKNDFCLYMSGGAGYYISNNLYKLIKNYVINNGNQKSYLHWCDDLCIGLWINELKQNNNIHQIHNKNFNIDFNNNDLTNIITSHKVINKEQLYLYYYENKNNCENNLLDSKDLSIYNHFNLIKTCFTLITDMSYFNRAKRTIIDLRTKGNWKDDIVLITIDFDLHP